jgi:hypothetical protein
MARQERKKEKVGGKRRLNDAARHHVS